jgi:aminopeptidase N
VLVNDDDLTYAKIRLDEGSLRTLLDHVSELREPMPRALCWGAAWDMTRDAEMRAGDFLELVLAGIDQETQIVTVQTLLRLARQSADPYGDPSHRDERVHRLADKSASLLMTAPPGTDHQLAFARALAANASTDEQLDLVAALLSGDREVEGLAVDTELRWTLLQRLVVMGRAGEREIERELDRDPTAAGRRHALTAHAAQPTAAAKEEAWRLAVDDLELPNAEQAAVIAGFQQQEHRELLLPYRDRYFEVVADAWTRRTSEMAQQIAVGLFPVHCVEPATVDQTDRYLRDAQPVPALRRLITESRDTMARALRAQDRDRG